MHWREDRRLTQGSLYDTMFPLMDRARDVYWSGVYARSVGLMPCDNPYQADELENYWWFDGWYDEDHRLNTI